jgi:hypothetical protein
LLEFLCFHVDIVIYKRNYHSVRIEFVMAETYTISGFGVAVKDRTRQWSISALVIPIAFHANVVVDIPPPQFWSWELQCPAPP